MKIHYDARGDAAYITFKDAREQVTTVRLTEDIAVDFGPGEEIYGIEILSASEHLGLAPEAPSVILENLKAKAG
jgi:uncharacterized protein YuzE